MVKAEQEDGSKYLKPSRGIAIIVLFLILCLITSLFFSRSEESKRIKLPPRVMSESQSINSAKKYLTDVFGSERVSRWQATIAEKPFIVTQEDEDNGYPAYPRDHIDYIMNETPSEFPLINNKYIFTTQRIVRFQDLLQPDKEAIDVYLDSTYRVFGMKHHHTTESIADLAEDVAKTKAFQALAQIPELDNNDLKLLHIEKRLLTLHSPYEGLEGESVETRQKNQAIQGNSVVWQLLFRDEHIKINSRLICGYKVSIRGNTISEIIPYADLTPAVVVNLAEQRPTWRRLQQVSYIFFCIYVLSGLIMMFRTIKHDALKQAVLFPMIVNLLLNIDVLWSSKISQIFTVQGFWLIVMEIFPILSTSLIGYGFYKPTNKTDFQSKYFNKTDLSYLILIVSLFNVVFMNRSEISLQRFVSPHIFEVSNGINGYIGATISMFLILMSVALYYRHLVCLLTKYRWGKMYALLIAFLLSSSIILIVNPQVYSVQLMIYSVIGILSFSIMLYLLQFNLTGSSFYLYSMVFYYLSISSSPFYGSTPVGLWWFHAVDIAIMVSMVWLFAWLLNGKFSDKMDTVEV
ncbi:MAG: hypothetical protein RBQ67_03460 [Candidatus Cloacimonadaceae bacterium]|nr:hypothetical protein [Candidatus Cloacimonadaceae bacterium]